MFLFILRRLLQAIPILILASVLTFILVTCAGDPLAYLKDRPNAEVAIANRKAALGLDRPACERYLDWATGLITGDFGKTNAGRDVWPIVWNGLTITLRLVLAAAIIAVIVGVIVGVFSAIRQYSAFDYSTTFLSFLFFAMPVFWFAVLLKQYGAISFNDWLRSPSISVPVMVVGTIIGALAGAGLATLGSNRGDRKRALIGAAIGGGASLLVMIVMNAWFDGRSFKRWIATVGPETPNFQGSFLERIGDWLGPHAPADHHAGRHQLRHLQPVPAGVDARHAVVRLRAHRPGQGPQRTAGHHQARLPDRAHPGRHARGPGLRAPSSEAPSSPRTCSPGRGWARCCVRR